ncbi:MAG: preprotein translocase subunit TatB [Deltaproteobacteria bacterium]|jgi:TusA-related sulfurtransferase|nr:preprotein translocase subunit TatB [Deltaproteobacteria bacterium]
MNATVDARGLSCPQPVLATLDQIKAMDRGEIVVLVDTDTSKENVIRAAASKGWALKEVQPQGVEYRITLVKS